MPFLIGNKDLVDDFRMIALLHFVENLETFDKHVAETDALDSLILRPSFDLYQWANFKLFVLVKVVEVFFNFFGSFAWKLNYVPHF